MKKIKYLLFILVLFLGINKVYAAGGGSGHSFGEPDGGATCSYDITISDSKWEKLTCTIESDGDYDCYVYNSSDDKTIKFEAYNGSNKGKDIKSGLVNDAINNNTCPYIVYVETRSLFGSLEAYAFTNKADAMVKESERKSFYTNTVALTSNNTNTSVENQIKEYVDYFKKFGTDSKLDDYCILENGIYRVASSGEAKAYKANLCRDQKVVELENIKSWNEIVTDLVSDDKISESNSTVQEYFRLSNQVMMSLGNTSLTHNENEEQVKETNFSEVIEEKREAKQREKDLEGRRIDDCKGLIGDNTLKLLNLALNFLMIIGPIIALVLGTYDLIVALANGEEDAKKKGIKKMKNRLIAAALLLLLPYIVKLILNIAGRGGTDCINSMQNLLIFRSNF